MNHSNTGGRLTPPRILAVGEVLWDQFPHVEQFGGAAANFACHAARSGARVSLVSAVGDDRRGRDAIALLQRHGVDTRFLQVNPQAHTGIVEVTLDDRGKHSFTICEDVAWDQIAWNDQLVSLASHIDAVYFGTLSQRSKTSRDTIRRCLEAARKAAVPRMVDINLRSPFYNAAIIRESVELASILKLSEEELDEVGAAYGIGSDRSIELRLQQLRAVTGLDRVVLTCGANGAILASEHGTISQPGITVQVRDTVGAGDAFTAAFLVGMLSGSSEADSLRQGCETAAVTCTHSGAVPDPPAA